MNQKIKPEDIDRSHRLGNLKKSKNAKRRPIIVKYVRCNTRNTIYVRGTKGTALIYKCIVTGW